MSEYCMLSHVRLFETPWTVACQTPLSMGFPRQEYWSRLPFPPPENLPEPEIKPVSCVSCIGRQIIYLVALIVKNLPGNAGDVRDTVSVSGWGRSPGR